MARSRCLPARNALISTVGMGKRPFSASCVAAISPSVAAGTMPSASTNPTTGISSRMEKLAVYMKNRPVSASGCLPKVLMPSLTHWMPVRAGTMLSFMGSYVMGVALDAG